MRKALELSTNRATYVTATGGEGAGTPAWSILSPTVDPTSVTPPPGAGVEGDPEGARRILEQAGVKLPVPLRVVYARSVLGDKAYAALAPGGSARASTWQTHGRAARGVLRDDREARRRSPPSTSSAACGRPTGPPPVVSCPRCSTRASTSTRQAPGRTSATSAATPSTPSSTRPTPRPILPPARRCGSRRTPRCAERAATSPSRRPRLSTCTASGVQSYEDHPVGGIVDLATVAVR